MKQCTTCMVEKPLVDFHWHYKDKNIRRHACKVCRGKVEKDRQRLPESVAHRKEYMLKKHYGISQEEYNEKLKEQNNGCAICGKPQTTKSLAVDHCHTSGKIRSLLCGPCNTGLGQFMDNPELLNKAADYLRKHNG